MSKHRIAAAGGRVTRRGFIAAGCGLLAGGACLEGAVLEPRRLSVTRHQLGVPSSEDDEALRVVQLTDLHLKAVGEFEARVAEQVRDLRPDVVVLTGDSIDRSEALPLLAEFLELLPSDAERYATLGNWEYWSGVDLAALDAIYSRGACRLLVNETVRLVRGDRVADFVGLDDFLGGTPDMERAVAQVDLGPNVILLSHCPGFRDEMGSSDLAAVSMLSGHTHGGQVALARWAPFLPPGSGGYVSGWYRGGGLDLYVSRGLGTSIVPIRLGSVPEIALFEWFLKSTGGLAASP